MKSRYLNNARRVMCLFAMASCVCLQSVAQHDPGLDNCPEIIRVTGFKILLDDIKFHKLSDVDDGEIMRLFQFQLRNRLETLDAERGPGWKLLRCEGRFPGDANLFSSTTIDGLSSRDVILEMWAEISKKNAQSDVLVSYVLIPVPVPDKNPTFFERRYRTKSTSSPDELVEWLASLEELRGYALATRALRMTEVRGSGGYDQAKKDLETAFSILSKSFGPAPNSGDAKLLRYLATSKCDILRKARTDGNYSGPLKLLPDDQVTRECQEVNP